MSGRPPIDERALDLVIQQATRRDLAGGERAELRELMSGAADEHSEQIELAAAAVDVAWMRAEGRVAAAVPLDLRQKLLAQAPARRRQPDKSGRNGVSLGWLAAAAMLVVAAGLWWTRPAAPESVVLPDVRTQVRELLAGPDVLTVAWAPSEIEGYDNVQGDVVWSQDRQSGFMRLRGLPINLPAEAQYQLWIVDPERDKHPIDGGVFDVTSSGEVIVAIDAKLAVLRPAAFAITLEVPGGVVVSDGPLLVVAPVTG